MFKQTSLHCVHNDGTFKSRLQKISTVTKHKCSKRTAFDLIDS